MTINPFIDNDLCKIETWFVVDVGYHLQDEILIEKGSSNLKFESKGIICGYKDLIGEPSGDIIIQQCWCYFFNSNNIVISKSMASFNLAQVLKVSIPQTIRVAPDPLTHSTSSSCKR